MNTFYLINLALFFKVLDILIICFRSAFLCLMKSVPITQRKLHEKFVKNPKKHMDGNLSPITYSANLK